jgi:hypothetical protein
MDLYESAEECKRGTSLTYHDYNLYKSHYNVLDSWEDIERTVLSTYTQPTHKPHFSCDTVITDPEKKYKALLQKLKCKYYRQSKKAVRNSLYYMFYKYGSGAFYVRIREGKLVLFCYLYNDKWTNSLANYLNVDPKYAKKYQGDKHKWINLGAMIRMFEKRYEGHGMDFYYSETKYLILQLCESYDMPDCDFVVSNKDNLTIKCNLTEPCEEVVGAINRPLNDEFKFTEYCPIFSYGWNSRYADIPLPTPDDVIRIFRLYRPEKCINGYIDLEPVPWEDRRATAVFRGSYTGSSANVEKNPRLHVAMLNYKWKFDDKYNQNNPLDKVQYLDAGISSKGGFRRGRKEMTDRYIRFVDNNYWEYMLVDPLTHAEQMRYKYVLYIEGNVAAYRGAFLFSMGAVVIWVKTSKCSLWFEPYLKDRVNCVFVNNDLSNLADTITWLKTNDHAAQKIANAGAKLFDIMLSRTSVVAFAYQAIYTTCVN